MNQPKRLKRFGFDFDGVLSQNYFYQTYCTSLTDKEDYVCVITKNDLDQKQRIFEAVKRFGIKLDDIYCTNHSSKVLYVGMLKLDVFYDDEQENVDEINNYTYCKAFLVKNKF